MRRLLLVPALALALSGCATDPASTLTDDVRDVVVAANGNDAAGVRRSVDALLGTISGQVASRDLTRARGAELRELALAVQRGAASLDAPPPSPAPTVVEQPSPPPSPSPEPSPSPSPSPSPEPTQAPPPPPSSAPTIEVPSVPSPSPAAVQSSPAGGASPVASPL